MTYEESKVLCLEQVRLYDRLDILSQEDIRKNFVWAPTPVFRHEGVIHVVKTHWSKVKVTEREFEEGGWRAKARKEMLDGIALDESYFRRYNPAFRYHLHSAYLSFSPVVLPDYSRFYVGLWRAAKINWPVVRP